MDARPKTDRPHAPVPVLDVRSYDASKEQLPFAGDLAYELELKSLILDNSLDGFMAHDFDGRLIYFNTTAAAQLGYSRDEFAALGKYGWIGRDSLSGIPSRLALIRERGSLLFASRGATSDGSIVHTEVHSRLARTTDGGELIISVIRDVTERVLAHERIRHLAFHDRLTGLANRMKLEEDLRAALAAADRHEDLVGVVYLDLDDFKPINDELGHAVGDDVLRIVGERVSSCVRECDTVARLGGDEFLVLVTRVGTQDDLAIVARKIEACIERPIAVDGHRDVRVTTSAGLATYEPGEAASALIDRADAAMYRAKQAGVPGWEAFLNGG